MLHLSNEDKKKIVRVLSGHPLMQSARSRRQLVNLAGLNDIEPLIDFEGAPLVVSSDLVSHLESYGRVSFEQHSLGALLNTAKELFPGSSEETATLDKIVDEYALSKPVASDQPIVRWRGNDDPQATKEKIIGENTLRHVSFLHQALIASKSVALIDVGSWTGSGFLICDDILMTNHHVVGSTDELQRLRALFNFQIDINGKDEKVTEYKALPGGLFIVDEDRDVALVQLDGKPALEWGYLDLSKLVPKVGTRVNIIQHPAGLPKQVSFQNNFVEFSDDRVVQYVASTLGGSSGSPVMNDKWEVVAIHHAGGMLQQPGSSELFFRNEGITMLSIMSLLPDTIAAKIQTG